MTGKKLSYRVSDEDLKLLQDRCEGLGVNASTLLRRAVRLLDLLEAEMAEGSRVVIEKKNGDRVVLVFM